MMASKIVIGEHYRHKSNPDYAWAKAIEILKPKEGINTYNFILVKCEWMVNKNDTLRMIKYWKPCELVKDTK